MLNKYLIVMKKAILFVAALAMTALTMSAQDINQATEMYNNGAMELQMGNSATALEHFQNALQAGEALGDEAADLVANCKKAICSTSLSIAKDLYNSKDFAAAIEAFGKAKEYAETYGEPDFASEAASLQTQTWKLKYNTDAKAALSAKDFATAIENFKKVLEMEPENGNTAIQLAQAYMKSGDLDNAVATLNLAKENGQAANASKMLSQIYLKQAQAALKSKQYQQVIDLSMKSNEELENANAFKLAASAAQKLGKNSECITLYEKYLELSPKAKDASGVICTIAVLYQQAGNKEKAKEYYQQIVNDPQFGATAAEQLKTLN